MSTTRDTGGPAFPVSTGRDPETGEYGHQDGNTTWQCPGMSLRDYFMAHAPIEAQPWFSPAMPTPRPKHPGNGPANLSARERDEKEGWREYVSTADLKEPRIREWAEAMDIYDRENREWTTEHAKQRYIQWPAAWADEMLKARSA